MYCIYTFFLLVGLIVASPYYALHFKRYGPTVGDRLGRLKIPQLRKSIWVHAVSVGEVKSVQKLLERLRAAYPDRPIVLSTITPTGQQLARERKDVVDHTFYFPFDLPWVVRRTLDRLNPEIVIVAETEIWPNFLRACRSRGVKVLMVNGRISDRSLPRYRMIRGWLKRVLDDYTVMGMQSEVDRGRIEMLGADASKVTVFGNLKYDALNANRPLEPSFVRALSSRQPLWIAASTMPGEDELVLDAFERLRSRRPELSLLIAPRHPERSDEIEKLVRSRGLPCVRRTALEPNGNVLLLDTIGELAGAFAYATVVFMGGTLVPRGGHNVLEPAQFSKPIVFGPHMENFREVRDVFLTERAGIQIPGPAELSDAVDSLLANDALASELGRNARRIVERNTGATDRVMDVLRPIEAEQ